MKSVLISKTNRSFPAILLWAIVFMSCVLLSYHLLRRLPFQSAHVLGWEEDRYLWTAGFAGVARWDVNKRVIVSRSFKPSGISEFLSTTNGQVWVYGSRGVWLFEDGKWEQVDENRGLVGRPYQIVQAEDDSIWIATSSGISRWDHETRTLKPTPIVQPVSTLARGPDNSLWAGLNDGVLRLRSGDITRWTTADGLIDNEIRSLLVSSDGTVWVGTSSGASRWDGDRWKGWEHLGYPDPDRLVVMKLHEASDGSIWAGTSEGVAKWDGKDWVTYTETYSGGTYEFSESSDGGVWVGSTRTLFRWTEVGWQEYGLANGLADSSLSRLVRGGGGELFLSTRAGFFQYNPEFDRWESFPG